MPSQAWRWMLLLLVLLASMSAAPASAGQTAAEMRHSAIWYVPEEFFCITPSNGRTEVCVALYIDMNGYEICLSDELANTEQCTSYHKRNQGNFTPPALISPIQSVCRRYKRPSCPP